MRDRVDQDELDYDTQQGQWKPYKDDSDRDVPQVDELPREAPRKRVDLKPRNYDDRKAL